MAGDLTEQLDAQDRAAVEEAVEGQREIIVYSDWFTRDGKAVDGLLRFPGDVIPPSVVAATPKHVRERYLRHRVWSRVLASEVVLPDEAEQARRAELQRRFDEQPAIDAQAEADRRERQRQQEIADLAAQHPLTLETAIERAQRDIEKASAAIAQLEEALPIARRRHERERQQALLEAELAEEQRAEEAAAWGAGAPR